MHGATVVTGPKDQQIGAFAAKAIFTLNTPTAIEHALQKGLEQQLWTSFLVRKSFEPVFRMFAEERLKGSQEFDHVEATIGGDVPTGFVGDRQLGRIG